MKKDWRLIAGGVALVLVVAAGVWFAMRSGGPTQGETGAGSETSSTADATGSVSVSGETSSSTEASEAIGAVLYTGIPLDGAHEKAAFAAVPAAVTTAADKKKGLGAEMPDVSKAKATFTSYGIIARIDQRNYLFYVLSDGKAYEYLRYPAVPDPANQYALDVAGFAGEPLAEPAGTREKAAASAVQALMDKAFPGKKAVVRIWNYGFTFIGTGGKPVALSNGTVFQITISPEGKLTSME